MSDNEPKQPGEGTASSELDRLIALYPLYVAFNEASINWEFSILPPATPKEEQQLRAAKAPVPFRDFSAFLKSLGQDRALVEKYLELGWEGSKEFMAANPTEMVKGFKKIIIDSMKSIDAAQFDQKKRHKGRPGHPEDDGGPRR